MQEINLKNKKYDGETSNINVEVNYYKNIYFYILTYNLIIGFGQQYKRYVWYNMLVIGKESR